MHLSGRPSAAVGCRMRRPYHAAGRRTPRSNHQWRRRCWSLRSPCHPALPYVKESMWKHVAHTSARVQRRVVSCGVVSCGIVWCRVVCVAHRLMLVPPSRRHRVVGEQGHAASPPPDPARPLPRGAPPPLAPPSSRLPPAPPRPSPAHRQPWCHPLAAGLALELQRHVPAPCWRVV